MARDGASPMELLDQGRDEFIAFGGEVTQNEVTSLEQTGNAWTATTADGRQFPARQVLMATGITDELTDVPGPVSYTHLTLPTTRLVCRSRWGPYN